MGYCAEEQAREAIKKLSRAKGDIGATVRDNIIEQLRDSIEEAVQGTVDDILESELEDVVDDLESALETAVDEYQEREAEMEQARREAEDAEDRAREAEDKLEELEEEVEVLRGMVVADSLEYLRMHPDPYGLHGLTPYEEVARRSGGKLKFVGWD